jgi:hypothetical protein
MDKYKFYLEIITIIGKMKERNEFLIKVDEEITKYKTMRPSNECCENYAKC